MLINAELSVSAVFLLVCRIEHLKHFFKLLKLI